MLAAAREFTCAADEVWRLQRGSELDCVFFQRAVNGGERITDKGSRQGFWLFAPSGVLLARCNTRNVESVLATFAAGRLAYDALEPEQRALAGDAELEPVHRWEHYYPEDGLVLRRTARDLAPEGLAAAAGPGWNRDYAWFSRAELSSALPADALPADAPLGTELPLPLVARRLARFHLVDNARGQTIPYAEAEVEQAELVARVVSRRADAALELVLEGASRAVSEGQWLLGENLWKPRRDLAHDIRCRLLGRALWDPEAQRFLEFELVALARREGRTQFNGRAGSLGPSLLAFHFELAAEAARIAPTFVALYEAPWIEQPALAPWFDSPAECGLEVDGR